MTHTDTNTKTDAGSVVDEASDSAADLAERASATARAGAEKISGDAARMARKAQTGAADEVKDVASALRSAAEDMRSGSPQERTFSQIADGLADMSDAMRDKDMGEIVGELGDFGRRNPLAFLGGAALLGFAATRFAKASGGRTHHSDMAQPSPSATRPHATPSAAPSSAAFRATDTPRPVSHGGTATDEGV